MIVALINEERNDRRDDLVARGFSNQAMQAMGMIHAAVGGPLLDAVQMIVRGLRHGPDFLVGGVQRRKPRGFGFNRPPRIEQIYKTADCLGVNRLRYETRLRRKRFALCQLVEAPLAFLGQDPAHDAHLSGISRLIQAAQKAARSRFRQISSLGAENLRQPPRSGGLVACAQILQSDAL